MGRDIATFLRCSLTYHLSCKKAISKVASCKVNPKPQTTIKISWYLQFPHRKWAFHADKIYFTYSIVISTYTSPYPENMCTIQTTFSLHLRKFINILWLKPLVWKIMEREKQWWWEIKNEKCSSEAKRIKCKWITTVKLDK